jgi:hypothetical protein
MNRNDPGYWLAEIDARSDQQWIQSAEALIGQRDWSGIWHLAIKSPPIWTVRFLKILIDESWLPEPAEQLPLFESLVPLVRQCNPFEIPSKDARRPRSTQLDTRKERLTAARFSSDGELLFTVDQRGVSLTIWRTVDFSVVSRIRLDMLHGKRYIPLAFDISACGEHLAVLAFEPQSKQSGIVLYQLEFGEPIKTQWIKMTFLEPPGYSATSMSLAPDGKRALICRDKLIASISLPSGHVQSRREIEEDVKAAPAVLDGLDGNLDYATWTRYGKQMLFNMAYSTPGMSRDESTVAMSKGRNIAVYRKNKATYERQTYLPSSRGIFALSDDGNTLLTIDRGEIVCCDLRRVKPEYESQQAAPVSTSNYTETSAAWSIGTSMDPLSKIALHDESATIAVAMSHFECVRMWHLPEGRNLGTLPGLARDVILDFRFAAGGDIIAVSRTGLVQTWEADTNGVAWPWSRELVQITHQPIDKSTVLIMKQAQEMRRRGWLSSQECSFLDIALLLMQNRLNLDIEVDWQKALPGDVFDIEIDID